MKDQQQTGLTKTKSERQEHENVIKNIDNIDFALAFAHLLIFDNNLQRKT